MHTVFYLYIKLQNLAKLICLWTLLINDLGFPGDPVGKESTCKAGEVDSIPGSGRSPEKEMATTSVFFPRASYGQKGLAGHSPWSHKNWTQLSD